MSLETSNETITLALVVGYCLSSLNDVAEQLSKGDANKASAKVYEAIKFIKDKTVIYSAAAIDMPEKVEHD